MKRQRVTLTLTDTADGKGFTAQVQYQPSLKLRKENSPSVNAMVKLCLVVGKAHETLGTPLITTPVTKKHLTFWDKCRNFLR